LFIQSLEKRNLAEILRDRLEDQLQVIVQDNFAKLNCYRLLKGLKE
jgi:hypothetical protein